MEQVKPAANDAPVRNIDISKMSISPTLLRVIPADMMERFLAIPFDLQGERLSIAMLDPQNVNAIKQIQTLTGFELQIHSTTKDAIIAVLQKNGLLKGKVPFCEPLRLQATGDESPIINAVDKLFELAVAQRASDIHLEPQINGLFARFRIDGTLQTIHQFPKQAVSAIISRIKVISGMDVAEKRFPQDGQINAKILGKDIDMRVSTLPGKYGEKTVIRMLDKSGGLLEFSILGMDPVTQSQFEMMIDRPQGLLLVTGPTGSGKTSTLYALINRLKSPLKNIITLEDPIEYELLASCGNEAGITQVQVNPKIDLTFAAALRASLRQDPDVIMVGEIRDQETAEVSMKAAMTGHIVLSTLHTNDAPSAVGRLRDIGVEPYLIASTLLGVLAQRLLRVLCVHCKEPYDVPGRAMKHLFPHHPEDQKLTLYRPKGCEHCHGTGYWGRKGIFELLVLNDTLRAQIHENVSNDILKKTAVSQGLRSLRESGLEFVRQGLTTVEEVFRHTVE
ncbi:MAG: GspE/PulE family protein [Elusimicrobiota bacterium]|jgi:type IV pilus assembly protein PilB